MTNLQLLRLAELQDSESYEGGDYKGDEPDEFKEDYTTKYNDIKQISKFVREDW